MRHLDANRLSELIPRNDWELCRPVVRQIEALAIPCILGGGLAFSFYSCRKRNTKDVDLLARPSDKDAIINILFDNGFVDLYDEHPYDRSWIYRATREGVICDLIWTLPNHRFQVDDNWFLRGRHVTIHGQSIRLITMEDLIRVKLYVLQRDRTDWPDVMNLIYGQAEHIQWRTLICLLAEDSPLLGALLQVYRWMEPEGARRVPSEVWSMLGLSLAPPSDASTLAEPRGRGRDFLLDTNDWFGPNERDGC